MTARRGHRHHRPADAGRSTAWSCCKRLSAEYPDVPVIMITAHGTVDNAVEAIKLGAFDYIEKPFEQEQIRQVVDKALEHARARARRDARPEEPRRAARFGLIGAVARDPADLRGDREGRGHAVDGADHRRERHRQGAGRARAARELARARTSRSSRSTARRSPRR